MDTIRRCCSKNIVDNLPSALKKCFESRILSRVPNFPRSLLPQTSDRVIGFCGFCGFPDTNAVDFNVKQNTAAPVPLDFPQLPEAPSFPAAEKPGLLALQTRWTLCSSGNDFQTIKDRLGYYIRSIPDRQKIEEHRDYVRNLASRAKEIATENKNDAECVGACDAFLKGLAPALSAFTKALKRDLYIPLSADCMEALPQILSEVKGLIWDIGGLNAIMNALSDDERIANPLSAYEVWLWELRKKTESEDPEVMKLRTTTYPKKLVSASDMERVNWRRQHPREEFDKLPDKEQREAASKRDQARRNKMTVLKLANLPFLYERFETRFPGVDAHHKRIEETPLWVPEMLHNESEEEIRGRIAEAERLGNAELVGMEPLKRLPATRALSTLIRVNRDLEQRQKEISEYNRKVYEEAYPVAEQQKDEDTEMKDAAVPSMPAAETLARALPTVSNESEARRNRGVSFILCMLICGCFSAFSFYRSRAVRNGRSSRSRTGSGPASTASFPARKPHPEQRCWHIYRTRRSNFWSIGESAKSGNRHAGIAAHAATNGAVAAMLRTCTSMNQTLMNQQIRRRRKRRRKSHRNRSFCDTKHSEAWLPTFDLSRDLSSLESKKLTSLCSCEFLSCFCYGKSKPCGFC